MKLLFVFVLCFFQNVHAEVLSGNYELQSSKVDYLVTYLIKKADGSSVQSKGKGECKEVCDFLIAAPVKSFESKDSNRDLNMLRVLNAEKYPLVVAKIKTKNEIKNSELVADVEIELSGVKKLYQNVIFKTKSLPTGFHAEGNFDLQLSNHKIERPSLLGVEIKDIVPITITADWKKI
jgi:hypothetical protein